MKLLHAAVPTVHAAVTAQRPGIRRQVNCVPHPFTILYPSSCIAGTQIPLDGRVVARCNALPDNTCPMSRWEPFIWDSALPDMLEVNFKLWPIVGGLRFQTLMVHVRGPCRLNQSITRAAVVRHCEKRRKSTGSLRYFSAPQVSILGQRITSVSAVPQ